MSLIEEYKQDLYSIKNNVDSNFTLSLLHVNNALDQSYISRISNQIYPTESYNNGALTKSLNNLNELFSGSTAIGKDSKAGIDDIKKETNNINSLLDGCKNLFLGSNSNKNNTIDALTIKNLLDSSLRYYESGLNMDSNGNIVSIKNNAYYQNALGLANRSAQLLNQMDTSQFQNNATKMNLFKELQKDFITYENYIKDKENHNIIMVLLHVNIHPNLIKLFNLK